MRPLFSFRWRSSGSTMGWREAGRRRWLVHLAPVREEEEDGRLGREGELGRPRGRGPVGRQGGGNGWLKREKNGPRLGGRLDGPAGRCADWAESEEKFFSD
jgi:hypothetical protein